LTLTKSKKKYSLVLFVLALFPSLVCAEPSLIVRPQAGYGYFNSSVSNNNGRIDHVGTRILLKVGEIRRYGLEISRLNMEEGRDFTSLGIVLEQRLWGWFNMSVGTVGYFDYGVGSENPVGLMTNLGWEPSWNNPIQPFITYRNDTIFSSKMDTLHALSIGLTFGF